MLKLAETGALLRRIEPQRAGAAHDFRIEFLLAGRIRSHGGDMRARLQIAREEQRGTRGRGGDDQASFARDIRRRSAAMATSTSGSSGGDIAAAPFRAIGGSSPNHDAARAATPRHASAPANAPVRRFRECRARYRRARDPAPPSPRPRRSARRSNGLHRPAARPAVRSPPSTAASCRCRWKARAPDYSETCSRPSARNICRPGDSSI